MTGRSLRYDVLHNIIGKLIAYIVLYSVTKNLPALVPVRLPAGGWPLLPAGGPGTLIVGLGLR